MRPMSKPVRTIQAVTIALLFLAWLLYPLFRFPQSHQQLLPSILIDLGMISEGDPRNTSIWGVIAWLLTGVILVGVLHRELLSALRWLRAKLPRA